MSKVLAVLLELKECSDYWSEYAVPIGIHERIDEAIAELLAQPEFKPDWVSYRQGAKDSKREPLSEIEIRSGYNASLHMTMKAFNAGVKFAEKAHGIGVDDV
jgi:hypothetical protein